MGTKKLLFLCVITMTMTACSNQSSIDSALERPVESTSVCNIRSYEDALKIAQTSITLLENPSTTRSVSSRKIDTNKTKIYKGNSRTRSESIGNDTLLYVFNFERDEGFAVIAAPKNVEPIIAVIEKGSYDPYIPTEIEGFNMFMTLAEEYIEKKSEENELRSLEPYYKDEYDIIYNNSKGPYLTVNWGWSSPEGEFCPNGIAGCSNVALGLIFSYYEYPASIDLTYSGADITTQSLNWTQMKSHQIRHNIWSCSDQETHRSISRLFRQIGELTNSIYHPTNSSDKLTGTEIYDSFIPFALDELGYQHGNTFSYNEGKIILNLNAQRLLYLSGSIDSSLGHGWVLDGFHNVNMTHYHYEKAYGNIDDWVLIYTEVIDEFLVHYNWGWYGDCNGYFNGNVYSTLSGVNYDSSNHNSNHHMYDVKYMPIYR